MKHDLFYLSICCMALVGLTGCIDDKYDLSDVDTNSEFKVNNLVVPVNVGEVTLNAIIDIDEDDPDSKIKVVNGMYAVVADGEYESDAVSFDKITASAPSLNPEIAVLMPGVDGTASLPYLRKAFDYEAFNIDPAIHGVDHLSVRNLTFQVTFRSDNGDFKISDLKLRMPQNMDATSKQGSYDSDSGVLTVPTLSSSNGVAKVVLDVDGIAFDDKNSTFDYSRHYAKYSGHIDILSGTVSNTSGGSPDNLTVGYNLSMIDVADFSGDIQYDWKDFDMETINLSDIPDFLNQEGTDIRIVNPQLYLSFNNPLYSNGAWGEVGFRLQAYRDGEPAQVFSPDADSFYVGKNINSERSNLYFAPEKVTDLYPGYPASEYNAFSSLGDVLGGNGIPKKIAVDVTEARFPLQKVKDLKLGVNLGVVKGNYTFYAPLNLKNGSMLKYHDVIDGWGSEDLDALTISTLQVNATVSTDLPFEVSMTGYPVKKGANGPVHIGNVEITGAQIPANAKDYPITLTITGAINNLDGIDFTAYCVAEDAQNVITPDQRISLKNIRAKVSGNYKREL